MKTAKKGAGAAAGRRRPARRGTSLQNAIKLANRTLYYLNSEQCLKAYTWAATAAV